jgi:hypothetical protein
MYRLVALATIALVAIASLPIAAQAPAVSGATQTATTRTVTKTAAQKMLPGTRPDVLTTIQGNALSSTNGQLTNAVVRLRDARFGRIVDTQLTDKSGLFAFKAVDPGTYIVEVMGSDTQSVLAASQMLNVNAGEAVSAVVKLPFRIPPFAGLMGSSTTPTVTTAATVTTEAAASGVAALVSTEDVSPKT